MIRFLSVLVALSVAVVVQAQTTEQSNQTTKRGRPDLPGTFLIDYGLNATANAPDNFALKTFGSQTFDAYYLYDIRLGASKFTIAPGFGISAEHYKFSNNYTLEVSDPTGEDVLNMVPAPEGIKKSQLITNYLDVPLEFRYTFLPDDPSRSFRIGLGFRGGVLINSLTKLKIESGGQTQRVKIAQDYHVSNFRYGPFARIYIGNFNFFAAGDMTPVFRSGKGPEGSTKDMTTITLGISLVGF